MKIHSVAVAIKCRERGSHLDASDEAWVYWEREQDGVLGVHRLGFTVPCDRKMPFPLFFTELCSLMPVYSFTHDDQHLKLYLLSSRQPSADLKA